MIKIFNLAFGSQNIGGVFKIQLRLANDIIARSAIRPRGDRPVEALLSLTFAFEFG
jgi:hypothetical protein